MRAELGIAVLLAWASSVCAGAEPLDAERLGVRVIEPAGTSPARVAVRPGAVFAEGVRTRGAAVFAEGIPFLAPAPGLSMGPFTNASGAASSSEPSWWRARGVIDAGADPEDFAAATQGQVKWLAWNAAQAFAAAGRGAAVADVAATLSPSNNALPVCLAQLKEAAAPFWRALVAGGEANAAPWSGPGTGDWAPVNVGQVKRAFAFEIPPRAETRPASGAGGPETDLDGDGLTEIEETGGLDARNELPWLAFASADDLTATLADGTRCEANWPLPVPLRFGMERITNAVVGACGLIALPRAGCAPSLRLDLPIALDRPRDGDVLLLAPFWDDDLGIDPSAAVPTRVRAGLAEHGGARYLLFEYEHARCGWPVQTVSFQVAVPVARPDRAFVRYRELGGEQADGRTAVLGFQALDGRTCRSYGDHAAGSVREGLALRMFFGHGTDPRVADSDGDGLCDGAELALGTDPARFDTDGDGMPDAWERTRGLDPLDPSDAAGDPDGDGVGNLAEYLHGGDPRRPDADRTEDPFADGDVRSVRFDVDGDFAAWELTVEGIGPHDLRTRRISMIKPDAPASRTLRLRKGNSYRLSMTWLNCDGHQADDVAPWYCWGLQIDGQPRGRTFSVETDGIGRTSSFVSVHGRGWVLENADGLASWHTCTHRESGGNLAQGRTATLHVLGDPLVVFDYDRDGRISDADVARARGPDRTFRFWRNDDGDAGDVCEPRLYLSDCPGYRTNHLDSVVNGRRDLLDFTPVWIDVGGVFPPDMPRRLREELSWKVKGPGNAVWTTLGRDRAGAYRTQDVPGCGETLDRAAHRAYVVPLENAILPSEMQRTIAGPAGGALFLFEGGAGNEPLRVVGMNPDRSDSVEATADLRVASVETMYRWLCLRDVCGDDSGFGSRLGDPAGRPDATCDGTAVAFVHGFNVGPQEARAAGAEMFKRLWQSGSDAMFTVVDWFGDDQQYSSLLTDLAFDGPICPDYYVNVLHAFESAPALARRLAELPGKKTLVAHSLGNVLVSAAAVDEKLAYERYCMLNAAVAMESYDAAAFAPPMVDRRWRNVPPDYRAANWHGLHPPGDFRRSLSWRGRFAGLARAVNFFSPTEEVLANAESRQLHLEGSVWKIQETSKGMSVWHALNGLTPLRHRIACEGGWGVNAYYALNPVYHLGAFTPAVRSLDRPDVIRHPLFTPFREEATNMHALVQFTVDDPERRRMLRAKFLADAIPAESFATGANPVQAAGIVNVSLASLGNDSGSWPEARCAGSVREWHHSDMKNLAYFYVHSLFDRIARGDR